MYVLIGRHKYLFGENDFICEYIVDTENEVSTLPTSTTAGTGGRTPNTNMPCGMGSLAYIAQTDADHKLYVLNGSNEWVPQ